ncbi:MAG: hypothetical protein O7C03_05325 [Gammaproteobacteria bacterium]|nr:hypothetical protein [Gammaproteobacteria bacterium]MCZ6687775.1 hypothetical protein [Gammaproteobacteria bacterium]MCZ6762407.1 hypothetical protein [Gammaproteobacteria bacterium]MCZ6881268.1 hypothetical protein [Gammaproteobacteria bacterium]
MNRVIVLLLMGLAACASLAEPVNIKVRVLANDAKFVGTSMGGVRVVISDIENGTVLANGITRGATGDTGLIMRKPRQRGASIITDETAVFSASIDISRPTRVRIEASGPLGFLDSMAQISVTHWLIPGHDIVDGWTMTLPGFVLELIDVPRKAGRGDDIPVHVKLVMMCGCPTEPGGLWDSDQYTIKGQLWSGDRLVSETDLEYTGTTSHYRAVIPAIGAGVLELLVYAVDTSTGNTAVVKAPLRVDE